MMKCAISAALLVAFASPLLAGSPTTPPLGGETVTAPSQYYRETEYYVVRDPGTNSAASPAQSRHRRPRWSSWAPRLIRPGKRPKRLSQRSASDEAAGAGMTRRRTPKGCLAEIMIYARPPERPSRVAGLSHLAFCGLGEDGDQVGAIPSG